MYYILIITTRKQLTNARFKANRQGNINYSVNDNDLLDKNFVRPCILPHYPLKQRQKINQLVILSP